ncbi:ROK family protein [Carnobacterium gallinarum]|uniref:ROK family protein n=1 Tax=Carnobacterium gallinarum TaxID=2749 RepID=UPI00054EBD65|nr:ROK family protein [Carnobacterium gallinarum]
MNYYVGIDVGGTDVKYGLVTEVGEILASGKVATAQNGPAIIASIAEVVQGYQDDYDIQGVGLSVPGIVAEDGFMITGGAIFDFYGIHLKDILEEKLGLPVAVENDVNCAALAEKWLGAGKKYKHFLCVAVGTGIGGAIVINNQLFRGANSMAGEFGFMVVEPIENQDTRLATLSLTGSVQCGIVNKYLNQDGGESTVNGKEVFDLAENGDQHAKETIEIFYQRLSQGLFNLATSFDPEVILIGGAISSNPAFILEIEQRMHQLKAGHRDMENVKLPQILPCEFRNNAGLIGAVYQIKQAD